MSHINRRRFVAGAGALAGAALFVPIRHLLPTSEPAVSPYASIAKELVDPIFAEIRSTSLLRQMVRVEKL